MSKTIAPSVALTTRATVPVPRRIPNCSSSQSPMNALIHADYQVADEAIAAAAHDGAGEPPGDYADDDDETFVR